MKPVHVLLVLLVLIFIVGCFSWSKKENFGTLGALGPYRKWYASCLKRCERSDPRLRLGQNNLYCGMYCDSVFTAMQQKNIFPPLIEDNPEKCLRKCKLQGEPQVPGMRTTCADLCYCREECKDTCRMDCAFSDDPSCMRNCTQNCFVSGCNN